MKHRKTRTTHTAAETSTAPESKEQKTTPSAFFKKVNFDYVVLWAFLLFALVLVFSIRMLPASLPVTDDWADATLRQNVRAQVAAQVDQQFPALPQTNRDALIDRRVNEIISQQQSAFDETKTQLSGQFREQLRYTGEDGRQHTYLGDLDSYHWLRYTRNILEDGNVCDEVVNGQCRDQYVLAPQGNAASFNPTFHVFAIFGLYKVLNLFTPGFPLPATSFLVQALLGALAVIPAFFIGRRLAGNVGGLFAAVITALHPLYLSRSLGSDTDLWIIALSLFAAWMVIEALEAKSLRSRIIFTVLGAAFIAWLAASWAGWWFFYLVILFGLVGTTLFWIVTAVWRQHERKPWKDKEVQRSALILGIFYVGSFLALLLAGQGQGYFRWPLNVLATTTSLNQAVVQDFWPNVLTTVAELNKSTLAEAIGSMGGKWFFFLGLTGVLLMLLPRFGGWKLKHYALLAGGLLVYLYIVTAQNIGQFTALGLIALPVAGALLLYLFGKEDIDIAPALILLVWFLAATYATYSGVRFILLMIPAFGIAFAVTAGRVFEWLSQYMTREIKWHHFITNTLVFVLIALLLIQPVRSGYATAYNYIPSIDDAWWDSLTKINDEAQPDAIISSWWDFGHWFKYVADRRVLADGTTQHTHVPPWIGIALVTEDEDESIGVLRMLSCGSDAYPAIEGERGAYGKVLNKTSDSITAQQIVHDLVVLDKESARQYLAQRGFSAAEQADVLNVTHCDPPEHYFITSGDMVGKAGVWAHFGLWNFTRAYVAGRSRNLPADQAIPDLQERFNMSADEAERLYYDARGLVSEADINQFAAPWPGYLTGWSQCTMARNNTAMVCPLGIGIGQQGSAITAIDQFTYNVTSPNQSKLTYGFYQNGQRVGSNENGTPGTLVLAHTERMERIEFGDAATSRNLAVLVDVPNRRILLTDPLLVQSQFTQLFYLDGRYSEHYKVFSDRTSFSGSRIIVWKVDWDGDESGTNTTRNATR